LQIERASEHPVNEGLLGTAAPGYADLILLLEVAMGLALLCGVLLARKRRYQAHAACQSAVVLLNLVAVALFMVPSFHENVVPKIPLRLSKSYYALATAHAALGMIAELAGIYILIAAGTNWLPERVRLQRYKLWMRTTLGLWWATLLLGISTYARWYTPHLFRH